MKRALLFGFAIWVAAQSAWLVADERITEGDVLGNVGALELFWQEAEASGLGTVLRRGWLEDFGEYPALVPAAQGWVSYVVGVEDLGGDGPALVGLAWMALLIWGTWGIGRRFEDPGYGALLVLLSPFVAGLGRHVLLELPMAALVTAAAAVWLGGEGWKRWVAVGALAGLALLAKQTAVLALVPLAVFAWRQWRGLAVAGAVAAVVAGPWYARRLGAESEYLLRSAEANPDAVGWLHQLFLHPMALLQLPWGLWGLVGLVGIGIASRVRPVDWRPLAVAGLMLLPLLVLPKKYPRLLLPLLPWIAVAAGAWMARWPARARTGALVLLVASWGLALGGWLTPTMWGLRGVDERCAQDWVRGPHPVGVDWDGIVGAIEGAGGELEATRVGAVSWPVPPCSHQTTLDLGEHLRIEARRQGLEAFVQAGESLSGGGWADGAPELIVHEGALGTCSGCGALEELGRWPVVHPEWSVDLRLSRRLP